MKLPGGKYKSIFLGPLSGSPYGFIMKSFILVLYIYNLMACEDIIDVELRDSEPQLVIEGTLSNQDDPPSVRISKSTNYFDPGVYPQVSGAIVEISDDLGFSEVLTEMAPGVYVAQGLAVREGSIYSLKVDVEDRVYTAESRMEYVVPTDSLELEYIPGRGFFEDGYYLHVFFTDPPNRENHYRIIAYRNGVMEQTIHLVEDTFLDGLSIEYFLFAPAFQSGDTIMVDLVSIDPNVYKYFETLNTVVTSAGGGNPANPANPVSNISNDALGYFGALAINREIIVIE